MRCVRANGKTRRLVVPDGPGDKVLEEYWLDGGGADGEICDGGGSREGGLCGEGAGEGCYGMY